MLAVGLLPVFLIGIYVTVTLRAALENQAEENLANHAALVATSTRDLLDGSSGDLRVLAANPIVTSPMVSGKEKEEQLVIAADFFDVFDDISLIDTQGRTLASSSYLFYGAWTRKSVFADALEGRPGFSDVQGVPTQDRYALEVSAPVMQEDGVGAVLVGRISLARVWSLLDQVKIGHSGIVVAFDRYGNVIAHPDKSLILTKPSGYSVPSDETPAPVGALGGAEWDDMQGFSAPVGLLGWRIVAMQERSELYGLFTQALKQLAFAVLVVIASTVGLTLLLSHAIAGSVEKLVSSMRRMAKGRLDERAPHLGLDDVDELAEAFNAMADNLETAAQSVRGAQDELRSREERFRALVQHSSDVITVIDTAFIVLYQSPSIKRVLGRAWQDIAGVDLRTLVHSEDVGAIERFCAQLTSGSGRTETVEIRMLHGDGSWRSVEIVGRDQTHDPAVRGLIMNSRDVTERRALEEQLKHEAFHDSLTSLANRALFRDRLDNALARAARTGVGVAVAFIDLDDFKAVNDSLGHSAGDRMLAQIGERLHRCARAGDTLARLGGDEFAVLAEDADTRLMENLADRLLAELGLPLIIDGHEFYPRASVGIAFSTNAQSADELLSNADLAMYAAKSRGKGRVIAFSSDMRQLTAERLALVADLQRAITRGEFVLHYQPNVDLASGRVLGVEALVRWQHPERGLLPPGDFIPQAEGSGAIVALGTWVLREACAQVARWQAQLGRDDLTVAVNVSARQVEAESFVGAVEESLRETGLAAGTLVIEITESILLPADSTVIQKLLELKKLGVQLALDDFGTGYSSLSYLRDFPLDVLKIDRAFVQHVADSETAPRLLRSIVDIAGTLDMDIIAEGVEEPAQARELQRLGCKVGQGFLFSKPVVADELETQLRANAAEAAA